MAGIGARPFGVTLVGFIIIIEGILALIAAVVSLFGIGDGFTSAILAALVSVPGAITDPVVVNT